jgi:hypothetical protein
MASPARTRPKVKHVTPVPLDASETTKAIADVLTTTARYRRIEADQKAELAGLVHLLRPYSIKAPAIRLALGLAHAPGGSRRGTAHAPNARLSTHGATLDGIVKATRDKEVYFRAAYVANAAQRIQNAMDSGADPATALKREVPYYQAHERARRGRLEAAAQVQVAAQHYGRTDDRGTLLGWYLNPLKQNEVECQTANGHNFYAEEGTVIGLPGSVHNNCGCYAGAPHQGATLVNDELRNFVRFPVRARFHLNERRKRA